MPNTLVDRQLLFSARHGAFQSCLVVSTMDRDGQRRRRKDTEGQTVLSAGNALLLRCPRFAAVVRRRPGLTLPRLRVGGRNVHTGQHLLGRLTQHALHVADKAVDVAFAGRLVDDVLVVVVAQASAQLLVVHLGFVLALAPALGHLQGSK